MQKWIFFAVICVIVATGFIYNHWSLHHYKVVSDIYTPVNNEELYSQAKNLPTQGYLLPRKRVLKVSDEYIDKLYPILLHQLSWEERKCLLRDSFNLGAHITLFKTRQPAEVTKQAYPFAVRGVLKEIRLKRYKNFTLKETWYEIAVDPNSLINALPEIDLRFPLHISIAVATTVEDTGLCFLS